MRDSFMGVLSASTLIGDDVRNRDGESLGKLEEIMVDLASGRVAYAVLSFGGFLGVGNKLFAVPWQALELNQDDQCFILDVSEERLEDAPGFNKDNWPEAPDQAFMDEVYAYYEVEPFYARR